MNRDYKLEYEKSTITKFLYRLNIVIFILEFLYNMKLGVFGSIQAQVFIDMGAMKPSLVSQGEYWRLVTPIFLHGGILHLFMNNLSLMYIGPLLEKYMGKVRFLSLYLLSGVLGSIISYISKTNDVMSVGASGAIFGIATAIYGLKFLIDSSEVNLYADYMLKLVGINFLISILIPFIDMGGHLGGAIGGFLLIMILGVKEKSDLKSNSVNIRIKYLFIGLAISLLISRLYLMLF